MKVIFEAKCNRGKLQIVQSRSKYGTKHFWRTLNSKGEQLSRSSENYERLQGCLRNLKAEQDLMSDIADAATVAEILNIKL